MENYFFLSDQKASNASKADIFYLEVKARGKMIC